ncbi:MAG: tyrosine--tRNA ligase [Propionibacteriaceae bacterium]|jgi:tyrosyl-tRNA synthetase|nr:tyrosine--tRNA ligase [Propionibacteriaceae bacterium]
MNALLDELNWRGFIKTSTDLDALATHLDSGPVCFYVGFDPTAPSLHMGNLVQLMLVRRFQAYGHRPILLVGGSTGLIGDPKQAGERNMNPKDIVAEWVERIRAQVSQFVSFEGDAAATLVNNYDWTAELSTLDFLRDVGKHFPVNRMLERDVVRSRLETGISYTEFSYILLQSYDFLQLYRNHGATLQTGGGDQWGNLAAGVELIRRADGGKAHALATPLLTKADGTKFGKTEAGTVWLDPAMTSPYAFYQFFLNAEDEQVINYAKIFTVRSQEEIAELARSTKEEPHLRMAQRALADDVTDLVHGEEARKDAVAAAAAVFGGADLATISTSALEGVVAELKPGEIAAEADGQLPLVIDALVASGVVKTRGEAKRAIQEGGAYVNNKKVASLDARLEPAALLGAGYAIVRRGKKTVGALRVVR